MNAMPHLKLAHIHEQGNDMLIFPLDSNFANKTSADKNATLEELQARANAAGLPGHAAAVWDEGGGRMGFFAPPRWHGFFELSRMIVFNASGTGTSDIC
jgi:hypothetical protein